MQPNPKHQRLIENRLARLERSIANCSPSNRAGLEAHVHELRFTKGLKLTSIQNFASAVVRADAVLGVPFREITVESARRLVQDFSGHYGGGGLRSRMVVVRQHFRWLFEVDRLSEQGSTCPNGKAIERVLNVPRPKRKVVGQVISPDHQDLLVASLEPGLSFRPEFPLQVRDAWFLRGLKATGHRISEFVSVRLRDVRFEMRTAFVQGVPVSMEVAWVDMDERAPDLKTGARGIYFADPKGIQALKAWLLCHPAAGLNEAPKPGFDGARDTLDPDAPLNLRANSGAVEGISPDGIAKIITKACRRSGLDKVLPAGLTPHDFRHTSATEDAINGSTEADLRQKFGWGPESHMPGVYVHLRVENMAERAIRNATVTQAVQAAPVPAPALDPAVLSALHAIAQGLQGAAKTGHGDPAAAAPCIAA